MSKKKILLLSGYDAASHRYWRKLLSQKLAQFEWTQLALADRYYSWRIRGSSLSFAYQFEKELSDNYDLLIATSMVDLASLRGFSPRLSNIPTIVYFHENQFVYPVANSRENTSNQSNLISAQLTSIYSALCADRVLFNSKYNYSSFFKGARQLFKRLPDGIPNGLLDRVEQKSQILAVPIEVGTASAVLGECSLDTRSHQIDLKRPLHIVWNHRWEYDKQPEVFLDALLLFKKAGYSFKLHLVGQSFRQIPDCFETTKLKFTDEIESFGFQTKENYQKILHNADIVVSTALHDFQGISLQEGIASGCIPVAPNRVAYPEYVSASNLYALAENPELESINLFEKLVEVITRKQQPIHDIGLYHCHSLIPQYQSIIESLLNREF